MKYIRTKDRIWLSEKIDYDESGHAYSKITDFYQDFTKKDVIKEANTIEKLCDCGVLITDGFLPAIVEIKRKNGRIFFKSVEHDNVSWDWEFIQEIGKVYGAIITDKGLIYVAKMNDKGELELL